MKPGAENLAQVDTADQAGDPLAAPKTVFSVITVVYNNALHLSQCLDSVHVQLGVDWEHIVIDGGSTDGSVELIRQRQDRLAYWCSERDFGIGDAMNKGLARARGEWVLFLHSDDYLLGPDALANAGKQLDDRVDIVGFGISYLKQAGAITCRPRGFTPWINFKTGFLHQGTLIRRKLFTQIGQHDPAYRIEMDYEFFLRAYRSGAKAKLCPDIRFSTMRDTGISSQKDWPQLSRRLAEERVIHFRHCNSHILRWAYHSYWLAYWPYRFLRSTLLAGRA